MNGLNERDDAAFVRRLGGADEPIVRDPEPQPGVLEAGRDLIDELLRRDAALGRRLGDLLSVLVHPHEKMDVVAGEALVSRDGVGADFLESVTEVRIAIGVINGGREIETAHSVRRRRWRRR